MMKRYLKMLFIGYYGPQSTPNLIQTSIEVRNNLKHGPKP